MAKRMQKKLYESELMVLQAKLVDMQAWVQASGARIVVIFEGRDAAGKGSTIKRVSEYMIPRVTKFVALPAPSDRDKTRWYFQRYVPHLPAAGEIVLMDRSWYNRAGVEQVMGYCTSDEYHRFLHQTPIFERLLVEDGLTRCLPPAPCRDRDVVDACVGCRPPGDLARDDPAVLRRAEDGRRDRPRAGARGHGRRGRRRSEG